jgi:endonuclease/exonuclease/phosphatase family metal-dependent hydrolase
MSERTIKILHWNIKYADPAKDSNQKKYSEIARLINKEKPDVVVLTEITSKAQETKNLILHNLHALNAPYADTAALCQYMKVNGGNSEHHMFLVKNGTGYAITKARILLHEKSGDRSYQIGGGTRDVGLVNINHTSHTTTYIRILSAHPSPCAFTKSTAVKNAQGVVEKKSTGKNKTVAFAFMVGDFNTESDGDPDSTADVTKVGANTHQSGMEIDFAVHEGVTAILGATGSRIQTHISDHSYQTYDVKYSY